MSILKRKIEAQLLAWKNKGGDRKPLLLNGARQVGKTYILRQFGLEHFKNVVYVNLEVNSTVASFFADDITPERLLRYLESWTKEKIIPGETLLIFDEIQSCERALTSLKYFCEEAPEFHVVAAGSLLGVAINRQHYSFPVGKVETLTLYPLDFEEYLLARGEEFLRDEITTAFTHMEPLPEILHQKATELFREYLIIGGMPACINAFLKSGSFLDVPLVQNEILDNYIADMAKYSTNTDSVKIRACYHSIPAQLAKDNKKFQYKVIQKGGGAAMFGASIEWLSLAGVVLKCQKIEQAYEPISVYADLSSFKLYMGDVGLLTMKSGISQQTVLTGEGNTFMGALTENYVAEQLAAKGYDLFYWANSNTAELDFVLQQGNQIVGVEVKKGEHVRSRSLSVFNDSYHPAYSIRFSLKNFGETNGLKSVPLYAAFCI
ncbi:MAG: ATP-binding protein [Oscillospiraceae bacterium]